MLGEKYLKAQIDVLNQEAIVYPPRYYEVTAQLKELEPLLVKAKEAKANTFSYQASPDYPVVKDKPKRLFILLGGAISGGLLSILVLIVGYLFKQNRRQENKG